MWCWGLPMWGLFSVLIPYSILKDQSWQAAGMISLSLVAKLLGGAAWGLVTKKMLLGMAGLGKPA
ncbi:MAG: hypothetical protein HY717_10960 [Planctomycetes bacterium]|nr:hypothetical protein [Planctomycetota bacterium]